MKFTKIKGLLSKINNKGFYIIIKSLILKLFKQFSLYLYRIIEMNNIKK